MNSTVPPDVLAVALDMYRSHGFDPGPSCWGQLLKPGDDMYLDPDGLGRDLWWLFFEPPAYRMTNKTHSTVVIDAKTMRIVKPRLD